MSKCLACNKIVEDDLYYILLEKYPDYLLCDECYRMLKLLPRCTSEETYNEIDLRFSQVVRNGAIPTAVRDIFRKADDEYWTRKESAKSYEDAQAEAIDALILTTGGTVEGYKVVKYLDIISCEVVFKNSFMNSISAGVEDFFRSLSFREQEMSGAMELIDRAKAAGAFVGNKYLGAAEDEAHVRAFRPLHAKCYAMEEQTKNGDYALNVVIAGVPKRATKWINGEPVTISNAEELKSIDALDDGFTFKHCGGTRTIYNEQEPRIETIDGHVTELASSAVICDIEKEISDTMFTIGADYTILNIAQEQV